MSCQRTHFVKVSCPRHVRWAAHASRTIQASQRPYIPPPSPQESSQPHTLHLHGLQPRLDPFRWLEAGPRTPDVLRYLQQENEYCKLQLQHLQPLRKQLEQEIAQLLWRQAIMMAAQQPKEPLDLPQHVGSFEYRREIIPGSAARFRHLRIPCLRSDDLPSPPSGCCDHVQPSEAALYPQPSFVHHQQQSRPEPYEPSTTALSIPTSFSSLSSYSSSCVFDEQQRAMACGSPAMYALHSFAPSPTFDMAAISETTQPVPTGRRLPDRFHLHIIDAQTRMPLRDALPDVSGDLGWVTLLNDGSRGGGRLYFTREAQRELWCLDVIPPLLPQQPQQPPQPLLQPQPQPQPHPQLSQSDAATGCPQAAPSTNADGAPVRAFRDPDGQPMQLVQYGSCLYSEALGNTGVPLEIRLLGVCRAYMGEHQGHSGAVSPCHHEESALVSCVGSVTNACDGATKRPQPGQETSGVSLAGLPILPRQPGRHYSVLHLALQLNLTADLTAKSTSGLAAFAGCSGRSSSSSEVSVGGSSDVQGMAREGDGPPGQVLASRHHTPPPSGVRDALLLWLRDLDHPNGCLLLVLVTTENTDCDRLSEHPQPQTWSHVKSPRQGQEVRLFELLPHDPMLRIMHVDVRGGDRVLCGRQVVDARGDPLARYELEELQIDEEAVNKLMLDCRTVYSEGSSLEVMPAPQQAQDAAAPYPVEAKAPRQLSETNQDICLGWRTTSVLVKIHRRRTVDVQGPRQHVLQIDDWVDDGRVRLACSSLTSPPVVTTVTLMPCDIRETVGTTVVTVLQTSNFEEVAIRDSAAAVQLRCDDGDPRVVMERLWAPSHDGVQIPITLCRLYASKAGGGGGASEGHSAAAAEAPMPLLLCVYGAYGKDPPLDYQPRLHPLLRRGVTVAVAHVRGGGQLGPSWYEAGRGAAAKINSHLDLLAAAQHLVDSGVTTPRLMCLAAESAGGWAAGPALNIAGSSLFRAAVLTVPTLDVLTSLLEDATYGPYELGNPRADVAVYQALRWSPYEGLLRYDAKGGDSDDYKATGGLVGYPALLLRIGLFDTNVPYWDPAKYMARLRSLAARDARVGTALRVMQVKPEGHEAYHSPADDALFCAFVLCVLGVSHGRPV